MRSSFASSLASKAPTIRLSPQWMKETSTDTKVTSQAACLALLTLPASCSILRLVNGASATAEPVIIISDICIAKDSKLQKPLYQFTTICIGETPATPSKNAINVSTTAKILGSGIYFIDRRVSVEPIFIMPFSFAFSIIPNLLYIIIC